MTTGSVIVALSGGKSSAWCADWAIKTYGRSAVTLYFNDTHWEHPDLYRFLTDLSHYFGVPITNDSDGRSPEQLFYDEHALANNRMPFCSRKLKAKRLQNFYRDGDTIVFGIGKEEAHRADRIFDVYGERGRVTKRWASLVFPLIDNHVSSEDVDSWLEQTGIAEPFLYQLGFTHNNCSGGCVRAGQGQWKHLYETLPDVYLDRERVEREVSERFGKRMTILKNLSLAELRQRIEANATLPLFDDTLSYGECFGVCHMMA